MQNNVLMNNTNPGAYFPIFIYPHVKLREKVQAVTDFGPDLQKIVDKMASTMYMASGVGLAAPQVGVSLNLFVMDVSEERNNLRVFINTEILESRDRKSTRLNSSHVLRSRMPSSA